VVSSDASPVTLICAVTLSPAASVPDDGLTVSAPSSDDGSEIDQETGPPLAVSVSVPRPSRVSSTVVVDRRSAPVSGAEALTLTLGDGDGVAVGSDALGAAVGVPPVALADPVAVPLADPLAEPVAAPPLGLVAEGAPDGDGRDRCRAKTPPVAPADGCPAGPMPRAVAAPVAVAVTPGVRPAAGRAHGRGRRRDRPAGRGERRVRHPREPEMPALRRPWKTMGMERSRALPHCRAVCGCGRTWIAGEVQHIGAERGRRRERLAGRGGEAEQRGGGDGQQQRGLQLLAPPRRADGAPVDVAADPLAQRGRQPPVPAVQQLVKRGAVLASRAADQKHRDRGLELVARSGEERVGVISGDPEHHGHLGNLKAVPELVDHVPFAVVEPGHRSADQGPRLGPLDLAADVDALIGLFRKVVERRRVLP
jgi:hypothetical protein